MVPCYIRPYMSDPLLWLLQPCIVELSCNDQYPSTVFLNIPLKSHVPQETITIRLLSNRQLHRFTHMLATTHLQVW